MAEASNLGKNVKLPRLAFVFASFFVFTIVISLIFMDAVSSSAGSSVRFLNPLDGLEHEALLIYIILIHCVRMQLGIIFNLENPSYSKALARVRDELGPEAARTVVKGNTIIWLLFVFANGLLPRLLTRYDFWPAVVDLFVQSVLIICWWCINREVNKRDEQQRYNLWIKVGDGLFVLLVITSLAWGAAGGAGWSAAQGVIGRVLDAGLYSSWLVLTIVLVGEIAYPYREPLAKARKEFLLVFSKDYGDVDI